MYINLSGLHVLLTGATHSVGKVIATKLGEAGATLALQYHKKNTEAEELAYALSNNSRAFQADFSKKDQLVSFTETILTEFSDIETIVNNLSHYTPSPFSLSHNEWHDAWNKNLALNLEASAYLTKKAIEHWRKQRTSGRIINISMPLPPISTTGDELAYISTKTAAEAFFHQPLKSCPSRQNKNLHTHSPLPSQRRTQSLHQRPQNRHFSLSPQAQRRRPYRRFPMQRPCRPRLRHHHQHELCSTPTHTRTKPTPIKPLRSAADCGARSHP